MNTCLKCGGTGIMADGSICPDCSSELIKVQNEYLEIPTQYKELVFDKTFLHADLQSVYGNYMEDLLHNICKSYTTFNKNMLICCRLNSGKTVWAYSLYRYLHDRGVDMPEVKDIIEVRNILNGKDLTQVDRFSKAPILVVKLPIDFYSWMFNVMVTIIDRRVRNGGCTIFLSDKSFYELKELDQNRILLSLKGDGSFMTVEIKDFYGKKETYND